MEITKKAKQQLTASPAIIDLQGIVKRFYIGKPNELEILHGIDLQVQEGQFVSIVGESGSGKSTLMNIIGALDQPTGGQYLLDGECVGNLKDKQLSEIRNQKIGFVFQTYNLIPRTSALANVEMPMLYAGVTRKERTERAKELLELVGMKDRMHHKPDELSGGQKQRTAIARAMANDPALILADESTGALDSATGHHIMDLFHKLHREQGKTIVLITHSRELAEETERIITLRDGVIVDDTGKTRAVGHGGKAVDETGKTRSSRTWWKKLWMRPEREVAYADHREYSDGSGVTSSRQNARTFNNAWNHYWYWFCYSDHDSQLFIDDIHCGFFSGNGS